MNYMDYANQYAGQASGGGGDDNRTSATSGISKDNTRNYINIVQPGYNAGAILEPFNAGSDVNGGVNRLMQSVFDNFSSGANQTQTVGAIQAQSNATSKTFIVLGVVAVVGVLIYAVRRK